MTTATDNHRWLGAIGNHPEVSGEELLAGYSILGLDADLTDEQIDRGMFGLQVLGFLRPVQIDGASYTYEPAIPGSR